MVVPGWSRSVLAARSAASKASGWVSHQFITRNRRVAVGLALVTVFISVAAVHLSESWFSPGLLILPVLAGGCCSGRARCTSCSPSSRLGWPTTR